MLTTNAPSQTRNQTQPSVAGLEILDVIAQGGHGTVYRAHQADHDRIVALKVLDARLVDDVSIRRFDRERSAIGRLSDHPAIVSLLGSGLTAAGVPYLMLEHAPSGSLSDRLEEGPLSVDEATRLVIRIAGATQRAHEAGVIHRDIKPANILCSAYGDWMLGDFGVASLLDGSANTNSICVSYAHTAPESFDGKPASPASDVYSLASVLATCLTTTEPFAAGEGEESLSTLRRLMTDPYPSLLAAGVSAELAGIVSAALDKDPNARPSTAQEFAEQLNGARHALGLPNVPTRLASSTDAAGATMTVSDMGAELPPPLQPPAASDSKRRRPGRKLLVIAALIAALVGGGVRFVTSDLGLSDLIPVAAAPFDAAGQADDGGPNADDANGDGPGNDGDNGGDNDNDGDGDGDGDDNDNDGDGDGNGGDNDGDGDGDGNGGDNDGDGDGDGNGGDNDGDGPGNNGPGDGNGPGNGPNGGGNGGPNGGGPGGGPGGGGGGPGPN